MKELHQLNTKLLIKNFKETGSFVFTSPYNNMKASFIPHCLTFFSTIPLVYHTPRTLNTALPKELVSMSKTLAAVPEGETRSKLIDLLWIMKNVPRGKLITVNQGKKPEYGALTPMFMYAHKLYNKVPYYHWDRDDRRIGAALGYFLCDAHADSLTCEKPPLETLKSLRKSKAAGKKYTDWPNTSLKIVHLDAPTGEPGDDPEPIVYGKELCTMLFQFWLANASLRDENAMLLDIYHFEIIPKPFDAVPTYSCAEEELEDEL